MVDSCGAGYFKDDLDRIGVSVITSTGYTEWANYKSHTILWVYAEPEFSNFFFDKAGLVYSGEGRDYDERDAFIHAREEAEDYEQNPMQHYEAWHSFFGP